MRRPLRLTLPYGSGEAPTSFASRLAMRNGCATVRDFCLDIGVQFQHIVDGQAPALRKLAELSAANPTDLISHAITKAGDGYLFRGQQLTKLAVPRSRVRVCPACLLQDLKEENGPVEVRPYGRSIWQLDAIRTCAVHGLGLTQIASTSGTQTHDFAVVAAAVVQDLEHLADTGERRDPSKLERYLFARLQKAPVAPSWLDDMPFYAAGRICEVVGAIALYGARLGMPDMTSTQWYDAGDAGFEIMSGGRESLLSFLVRARAQAKRSKRGCGRRAGLGRLYNWLNQTKDPAYKPVRDAVRRHLIEISPLGRGDAVFDAPVENRQVHSIRSAARETGVHPKRLRKLLYAAGFLQESDLPLADNQVRIPAHEVQEFLDKVANSMTLRAAAWYLNASRLQVSLLVRSGFIRPLVGYENGTTDYAIPKSELDRFLSRLLAAQKDLGYQPGFESIPDAARSACCSAAEIVEMILNGRLTTIGRQPGLLGYESVRVDVQETRLLVRRAHHGGLSLRQVEQRMNCSTRAVKALVDHGHLESAIARNPVNRCPQRVVYPAALARFQNEFISLHSLAKERGLHFLVLKESLEKVGVQPAFDPDEVFATLYRRSDLPPAH